MVVRGTEGLDGTAPAVSMPAAGDPGSCDPDAVLRCTVGIGTHGDTVVVVTGEVDLCSDADFRVVLLGALDQPHCQQLVVDLCGVRFLSARGIGALSELHARATACGTALILVADSRPALRLLQLTGMDRVLDIRSTAQPRPERPGPVRSATNRQPFCRCGEAS